MIADLHAHYAMHLMPPEQRSALQAMTSRRWRARWRATILAAASRLSNYEGPEGGPSVTMELLREGGVGLAVSVLYSPFAEIDLKKGYAAPPADAYFGDLLEQLELVEADVRDNHAGAARVATTPDELAAAVREGKVALVHGVEGGFHLGESEAAVRANVAELARRGVAYVTLAHLLWRRVATNSVAVPLPESVYAVVFPQPRGEGLSELGRAALEAMTEHGIMVDLAHMSEASLDETFRILDARDPEHRVPPIVSHGACRFGRRGYNLSDATVRRIGERGGLIGLSASERHLTNGLRRRGTRTWQDTVEVICAHVERIRDLTGGTFEHVAIGSDMDGFIRPAVHGLEHAGRMAALRDALLERYGDEDVERICSGNALRLLERHWGRRG